MTEMFEVSPLSPVREWASSRSFISDLQVLDRGRDARARDEARGHRDDLARRLPGAPAARGAVRVERLDLVPDAYRLLHAGRAPRHAHPHLVRLGPSARQLLAVDRVHPDEVAAELAQLDAGELQPLLDDAQG